MAAHVSQRLQELAFGGSTTEVAVGKWGGWDGRDGEVEECEIKMPPLSLCLHAIVSYRANKQPMLPFYKGELQRKLQRFLFLRGSCMKTGSDILNLFPF